MASILKRKGWYYLTFHDSSRHPSRKQVSLRTKRHDEAKRIARGIEREFRLGQFNPWATSSMTALAAAAQQFLLTRRNLSQQTQAKYASVLRGLEQHAGPGRPVASIDADCVQDFLESTPKAAITQRTYSTTLSPFFNWLIAQGEIVESPIRGIRLPRVPEKAPRYLSKKDVQALLEAAAAADSRPKAVNGSSRWLLPIISGNVYLGLRAGEVVNLQWSDVDLDRRTVTIGGRDGAATKNGRVRTIPLVEPAHRVLHSLDQTTRWVFPSYSGTQLSRLYLSRRFKHFARGIGLSEDVCFHSTRHTAASWLVMGGATLEAVRRYLGHSSVRVTERYAYLSADAFREQVTVGFENS